MNGQWIGSFDDTNSGEIVLNLDETDDAYEGVAYWHKSTGEVPLVALRIRTPNKNPTLSFMTNEIYPVNPQTGLFDTVENVQVILSQKFIVPRSVDANCCVENSILNIKWNTDIGTTGSCLLHRNPDSPESKLDALSLDWSGFKQYVSSLHFSRKLIF